jgi:hypothetical protein
MCISLTALSVILPDANSGKHKIEACLTSRRAAMPVRINCSAMRSRPNRDEDTSDRDRVMWSISSEDVGRAKEQLQLRRSEIEARYAEELRALDTELEALATLERAAIDFASRNGPEDTAADLSIEPPVDMAPSNGGELSGLAPTDRREGNLGTGSRWRLHLGSRPADAEAGSGLISAQR